MRRLVGLIAALVLCASTAFAKEGPSTAGMGEANRAASKVVTRRLEKERPDDFRALKSVEQADVVVVQGAYDHVQTVLASVGVPHVVLSERQFANATLNARQLLILNCGVRLNESALAKVRQFVRAGGFLYTTDWALSDIVQKAFPGYVAATGRSTGNDVVEVELKKTENALLKHLQLSKEQPKWWLESSSEPIRVLNKEKVEVLISSREMKRKYGQDAIAVTFPFGDGRVLHMASHFYLQQGESRSVAEKKKAKDFLASDSNVPAAVAKELAGDKDFEVATGGDLSSAYAAQQMTSNLVIERKKDQQRIDRLYSKRLAGTGAKVKVLEEKGTRVKVRSLEGEESWVARDALQ